MAFAKKQLRDTSLPDLRFTFLGFEGEKARIGIGIREIPRFVENVMVEASLNNPSLGSISELIEFYTFPNVFTARNLSDAGKSDEISKFMPNHFDGTYALDKILEDGGELLIPKKQTTYFWIQFPQSYSRQGSNWTPAFSDYNDINNGLKIDFGVNIPVNKVTQKGAAYDYLFYIPFAKIVVGDEVVIEPYDLGEIVYVDTPFRNTQGVLNYTKISSNSDP